MCKMVTLKQMRKIKYPMSTEKSLRLMESENKLVFVVDRKATKKEIISELERLFKVKVADINLMLTPDGIKKAYITLREETPALDVATQLGMM